MVPFEFPEVRNARKLQVMAWRGKSFNPRVWAQQSRAPSTLRYGSATHAEDDRVSTREWEERWQLRLQ
jgi:hypothetical protein